MWRNDFESSVFLVLSCVFVFKYSLWTFLNIKYSSRNGCLNEETVAEIFVGVISYKSGIFWVWATLLSMEISFKMLDAICGVTCLEKNPFPKFKRRFPDLGKTLLDLPIENQR